MKKLVYILFLFVFTGCLPKMSPSEQQAYDNRKKVTYIEYQKNNSCYVITCIPCDSIQNKDREIIK